MGSGVRSSLWIESASRCVKVNGGAEILQVLWMGGWDLEAHGPVAQLTRAPAGGVSRDPNTRRCP